MKIERFPLYDINRKGYVVSFTRKTPFILKPISMGKYLGLQLKRHDGLLEKIYLHRLVAEAFRGACPDGMECRHLDGDKKNNNSENLCWGTRQENSNDKKLHGTSPIGELNAGAKLSEKLVLNMREHRKKTGDSYKKIGVLFSVSTMTAYRAITKQSWGHI